MMDDAVRHVVGNFSVFGFDNEETALAQAIKELYENSFDAINSKCRSSNHEQSSCFSSSSCFIKICLIRGEGQIVLEVTDNGVGMKDPKTILRCFNSEKSDASRGHEVSAGRFGVGLSTAFIYSFLKTKMPMRIITKHIESTNAIAADFIMDSHSGKPQCKESLPQDQGLIRFCSGTKIRIALPWSKSDAAQAVGRVSEFVDKLLHQQYALHSTAHRTDLCVYQSGEVSPCYQRVYEYSPIAHSGSILRRSVSVVGGGSATCRIGDYCITTTINVLCEPRANRDGDENNNRSTSIHVDLFRSVNGMPVLSYASSHEDRDGLNCGLGASLSTGTLWRNYGYKICLHRNKENDDDVHQSTCWSLEVYREGLEERILFRFPNHQPILSVMVDLRCQNVPYADLRKSNISRVDRDLQLAVLKSAECAALQLSNDPSDSIKTMFQSTKEFKAQQVLKKYIPSIARSTAKILSLSKNSELHKIGERIILPASHDTILPLDLAIGKALEAAYRQTQNK